jgi:hypothetical protein
MRLGLPLIALSIALGAWDVRAWSQDPRLPDAAPEAEQKKVPAVELDKPSVAESKADTAKAEKPKEGEKKDDKDKDKDKKEEKPPEPWWERVPIIAKFPRPGWFPMPPTGPGYYSLFDCIHGEYLEKPPKYPYPRVSPIFPAFFNFSFAYLEKPDNTEHDFFDPIKRCHIGENWIFSNGGEIRYRYNNENDSRLTARNNTYDLSRVRVYGDLWYQDLFRGYVEFLDGQTWNQDLVPFITDRDYGDFLNFFIDLKLCEVCEGPVYGRVGRQELLYGSQRLVSTLDWVNTRRTFQGAKLFWQGKKCDVDLFCVEPVIPVADRLDRPDRDQLFSGLWVTYRPNANQTIDGYYLNRDQAARVAVGRNNELGSFNISTVGGRYVGDKNNWLWDLEGAVQFGEWSNQGILAKMGTAGVGYNFKDCCMNPTIWIYYDYASGDPDPGVGNVRRTFNQLFPFGHYYFGFIDVVGRQNINDFNGQIAFYPTKWITTFVQYHVFRLDSPKDALYAANGLPIRRDPTGRAGSSVGEEIDVGLNFHISKHQDIFMSYSHLYAGNFIKQTGPPVSPDYLYVQYSFRW